MNDPETEESRGNPGKRSPKYKGEARGGAGTMTRPRLLSLALAIALAVSLSTATGAVVLAGPASGAVASAPASGTATAPTVQASGAVQADDSGNVSAGTAVAGAIAVGGTELEADLDSRTVAVRLAEAAEGITPNATRAAVLADELERSRNRLRAIEIQRSALRDARESGAIEPSTYRVLASRMAVDARALRERVAFLESAADDLPPSARADHGIDPAAFAFVDERTANLTDAETDRYVRTLVGDYTPRTFDEPAENLTEAFGGPSLAVEMAAADVSMHRERLRMLEERAGEDRSAEADAALDCARRRLDAADGHLATARDAVERGDESAATAAVEDAREELRRAADCLAEAREHLRDEYETRTPGDDHERETPTRTWDGSYNETWTKSG